MLDQSPWRLLVTGIDIGSWLYLGKKIFFAIIHICNTFPESCLIMKLGPSLGVVTLSKNPSSSVDNCTEDHEHETAFAADSKTGMR